MCNQRHQFFRVLCLALLLLATSAVYAQNRISGKVINSADNLPVVGATVQQKGTTNATQTDDKGAFSIIVPGNATLLITIVGFADQEIAVNNRTDISVSMQTTLGGMNEVIV